MAANMQKVIAMINGHKAMSATTIARSKSPPKACSRKHCPSKFHGMQSVLWMVMVMVKVVAVVDAGDGDDVLMAMM